MLRRILVGLDGSPLAETIVRPVRALARRLGAEVALLHVTDLPEVPRRAEADLTLDDVVAQQRERAEAYLARVAGQIGPEPVPTKTAVRVGVAAEEIVRYAADERIDLIALATHGRSGMQRWLYGSVADAVLHTTTTPLLLFRPIGGDVAVPELRRVVVPLDGSELAESALPMAEELARAVAAPIVLLRVVEISGLAFSGEPFAGIPFDYQRVVDALRSAADEYLAAVAAGLRRKGLTVATRASVGTPADTITVAAREEPGSVVVMSTHGRTGWRSLVLGSVARRVVLLASGPVLLRRPAAGEVR